MTTFLHFQVGGYPFVVPATRLIAIEAAVTDSASRRAWRGRTLPLADLTRHVGRTPARIRHDLVLEDDEPGVASCVVRVDEVEGFVELENDCEKALPSGDVNVRALIDGICVNREDRQASMLFRLRVSRDLFAREAYENG